MREINMCLSLSHIINDIHVPMCSEMCLDKIIQENITNECIDNFG